ncbi:MAG TPA: bifunctional adenosylcobinamide kinase/adenosylcobinamide-phosphate guanylyltransferase [Holophagaceae bacterium]|nr:bifunctional adenosylcobinamide kinase/adenosylcobinamide-phosphate guanylyltransferase [Holophagaceae bacterium]
MGHITYLTGPVRSGKSRRAVDLATTFGDRVVVLATFNPQGADAEMQARVARHRAERPAWRTLEAPEDVVGALAKVNPPPSGLLFDCQTLWLSARLDWQDTVLLAEWQSILTALREAPYPTVIVGNEVGWSPVPESPVLRRWRDLAGWLGQATAAASDEAFLMVAGCAVRLK